MAIKKITFVLIISILLSCKNLSFVTYVEPMSNLELARYIRLIEHRRIMSLQNYLYMYNAQRNFNQWRYPIANYNINGYNSSVRNSNVRTNVPRTIPQTGTVGNTITTPNVQPPIATGNIKTKQ